MDVISGRRSPRLRESGVFATLRRGRRVRPAAGFLIGALFFAPLAGAGTALAQSKDLVRASHYSRRARISRIAHVFGTGTASAAGDLRMGGDHAYPPFEFLDDAGRPQGLDVELLREVAHAEGLGFRAELGEWPEQLRALGKGDVDVLAMFASEFRARRFEFSAPFAVVNHLIWVREGAPPADTLHALAGRSVLVEEGSFAHDFLEHYEPEAHLVLVSSERVAMLMLASGAYDAALVGQASGGWFKEKLRLRNVTSSSPPLLTVNYCYAAPKTAAGIATIRRIDKGLARIKRSGRYDAIYERWVVGSDRAARALWTALIAVASLLALVLAGALWTFALRRQVQRKTRDLDAQLAEKSRYAAERAGLVARLSEALDARDQFISIAAHELRTPITPLRAQFQLVERVLRQLKSGEATDAGAAAEQALRFTRGADQQLERLTRLVNNLLDMATVKSGQLLPLRPETVSLSELAQGVVERFATEAASAGCRVTLRDSGAAAGEPVIGVWDPLRIEQVLTNLIANALKYARGSEVTVSVDRVGEERAEIRVEDRGPGIPPDKVSRIFDPFERVTAQTGVRGLGLGLFITRQIVVSHGGSIRVESELGKGTCFIVDLPVQKAAVSPGLASSRPSDAGEARAQYPGKHQPLA